MWSVVQYRQIGKQVEKEWQNINLEYGGNRNNLQDIEQTELSSLPLSNHMNTVSDPRLQNAPSTSKANRHDHGHVIVDTVGHDDPIDPRNWALIVRCKNIAILSFLIFAQAWAGGADSMANMEISQAFGVSKLAENLSQAMYLFGIGSGCLFVGPLSETVGRNPTYLLFTFCYMFFVLGSAMTSTFAGQIVCRYFVGLFASATLAINGASVGDQFRSVKRTFVFPVIAWANVAAPMLAPVAGGWIVSNPHLGWRWCQWVTLIISGSAFLIAFLFLPETYLPILLDWKAKHLRRVSRSRRYVSNHAKSQSFSKRLQTVLPMPIKFFSTEPVIAVLGGYLTLLYVLLFSFLSGFDYIFKQRYQLSTGLTGSYFASIAAGSTAFTLCAPVFYSWARRVTGHVSGASVKPEFRLWPAIVTAPLLPISLLWLGWTNYPTISPWSGISACFSYGIVTTAIYVSSYEYIIDSYAEHGAVALASITMVRYLIAGGMVIAARPMYEGIGVHWVMTILGCIAAVLTPAPLIFRYYGEQLREKSPYAQGMEITS